jgi:hypothetical protein
MTTIVDKVKLAVVHRDCPDVETELGIFPSKDAAMPTFQEVIAKHDPLRASIKPVEAKADSQNSASYQRHSSTEDAPDPASAGTIMGRAPRIVSAGVDTMGSPGAEADREQVQDDEKPLNIESCRRKE